MKKSKATAVLALALTAWILGSTTTAVAGGKPRLAVVDFSVKIHKARYVLGQTMSDLLADALVQTGRYRVLERSLIDKIRQEKTWHSTAR